MSVKILHTTNLARKSGELWHVKSLANDVSQLSVGNMGNIRRTEIITRRISPHTDIVQLEYKYYSYRSTNRRTFASRTEYMKWNYWSTWNNSIFNIDYFALRIQLQLHYGMWIRAACDIEDNRFLYFAIVPSSDAALMWRILCSGKRGKK
jgi:hypothetical protein